MKELSLNILDIAMNSVKAGATRISLAIEEDGERLCFSVTDDGCGMSADTLARVTDPFYTTRKTRKVGLGLPFLKLMAEQTGGCMSITSRAREEHPDDHGTCTRAEFYKNHIDCLPLGDVISTVITLVQGSPHVALDFRHTLPSGACVRLSTDEIKAVLGDGIPLDTPDVILWLRSYLAEQYSELL
ncbi:MAG: sensor histidine kinase [Clostridia bacterium]|nr:sensor histidine kinase [Clostridia bacterium]